MKGLSGFTPTEAASLGYPAVAIDAFVDFAVKKASDEPLPFPLPGDFTARPTELGHEITIGCAGSVTTYQLASRDLQHARRVASTLYHSQLASQLLAGPGVYLVELNGFVKIGRAKKIYVRLDALQTAMPWELRVLAVLSTEPSAERSFHLALSEFRARGEWFIYSEDCMRALATTMGARRRNTGRARRIA